MICVLLYGHSFSYFEGIMFGGEGLGRPLISSVVISSKYKMQKKKKKGTIIDVPNLASQVRSTPFDQNFQICLHISPGDYNFLKHNNPRDMKIRNYRS